MLRIPSSLNSEVYVQLSQPMFNQLVIDTPSLTYRQYTINKPYLRKKNNIVRFCNDRQVQNSYLLVKDYSDEENASYEFAMRYLDMMHGVTETTEHDSSDCFLTNIEKGTRFYINSDTFNGDYAKWCLMNLDLITEEDWKLPQVMVHTSLGIIDVKRKDATINRNEESSPVYVPVISNVNSNKNVVVLDDVVMKETKVEVAKKSDEVYKYTGGKGSVFEGIDVTVLHAGPAADEYLKDEAKKLNDELFGFDDKYRDDDDIPETPCYNNSNDNFVVDERKHDYYVSNEWDEATNRRIRYEKEAMLKMSIEMLKLPRDPEFINEDNAIRRRMYGLFWELDTY